MIITIDGPGAAGKGTLASILSEKYNLAYFDTGMVYRATGLEAYLQGVNPEDEDKSEVIAKNLTFQRMMELSKNKDFRSQTGSHYASVISVHPKVRAALLKMQQDFALNPVFADGSKANGVVYDGRDTGTKVCPTADVKFFLTASLDERAARRFKEYQSKGINTPYETVYNDVKVRDERDATRAADPLRPAEDAHILDTTGLTIDQVVQKASEIIDSKAKK